MDEELKKILRYLHLGGLLAGWDEFLAEARRGRFSHERLLKHVLEAEYHTKIENARLLRRKRANIPELWEIETFPFDRQPKLDRKRIMSLYDSFDYMTKKQNLVWMGPTGCGKTGLATGFSLQRWIAAIGAISSAFPSCWPSCTRPLPTIPKRRSSASTPPTTVC